MGANQFQREYIEYLQERNTELLNRLNHMKQSYENKILSKDSKKDYLISTLQDVLNIFTEIPQEIDLFFEKITAAMGVFKNILLRKSEMVQLVEEISKALNSSETFHTEVMPLDSSSLVKNHFSGPRKNKKAETVKVSPMINGHVISTEPRIFLSRVPGVLTPGRRSEMCQLSPIIEASPDTSYPSNLRSQVFKEVKIPLERINLNKMSYNYISEESPKSRFKGPKIWKKTLSSNKCESDKRKSILVENNENLTKKLSLAEEGLPKEPENIDPLEGPSWLYEENMVIDSSSRPLMDYRRRKHRFATVFDSDEDCLTCFEENPKKSLKEGSDEFYKNHKEIEIDEGEDVEEIKERMSESSEDIICESFSSECGENYSEFKKRRRSSKREPVKGAKDSNDIMKSHKDLRKKTSVNNKTRSVSDTLVYSDTSDEWEIERNSMQRIANSRKSRKCERTSAYMPLENTPARYGEQGIRIITRSKDSNRGSTSIKDALENEVFVKLENSVEYENNPPKRTRKKRPSKKKNITKCKSKSKSRSPIFLQETEGRVRRKAAPSFKLVEPHLNTKLRRD